MLQGVGVYSFCIIPAYCNVTQVPGVITSDLVIFDGDSVNYMCATGYVLNSVGITTRVCYEGILEGSQPECASKNYKVIGNAFLTYIR